MSLLRRLRLPIPTSSQSITRSTIRSLHHTSRFFTTQSDKQANNHTVDQSNKPSENNSTEQSAQHDNTTVNQSDNSNQPELAARRHAFVPPGSELPSAFERIDESGNQPSDQSAGQSKEAWLNERDRQNAILTGTYTPPAVNDSIDSCPNPFYDETTNYAPFLDPVNMRPQSLAEITHLSNQTVHQSSTDPSTSPFPCELPPIYTVGVIDHQHHLPDASERSPAQRSIKALTYLAIAAATVYITLILDLNEENATDRDDKSHALNRARVSGRPHALTPLREWTHKHLGIGSVSKQPSSNQNINEPATQAV